MFCVMPFALQICIDHIKDNCKPCPCCRDEDYTTLLNKHMRGKVHGLKVRCVITECSWTGELGELQRHKADSCQYTEAECRYGCGAKYPKHVLAMHERDRCSNRPIEDRVDGLSARLDEELTAFEKKYDPELTALREIVENQKDLIESLKAKQIEQSEQFSQELQKLREEVEVLKQSTRESNVTDTKVTADKAKCKLFN